MTLKTDLMAEENSALHHKYVYVYIYIYIYINILY